MNSLFGNLGGNQNAASQAPASTGLFGNLNTTQPTTGQEKTGLFAGLNKPGQPAQPSGGGIFGTTATTTQPASGGLFGTTAATTQPAATNTFTSMFSGLNNNSQPAQPAGGGIFGSTNTTQPSGGGIFGTTTTTQPQATTNAFGATATTTNPPAASTNTAKPTGAFFDSLLAKSKKQGEGDAALEDLPSLQLGLGDLRQKLRKLGPRAQDRPLDGKAHYLLAASGVDPGSAVRDLGSLGLQTGRLDRSTHGSALGHLDVEAYLSNLQTKTTLGMIADGLERSVRDFDDFLEDNVTMEWEAQRKRIYQHFGIKARDENAGGGAGAPGREGQGGFGKSRRRQQQGAAPGRSTNKASTLGRSILSRSVIGTPSRIGTHPSQFSDINGTDANGSMNGSGGTDDRLLREKQGKLAEKIHSLNDSRQQGRPYMVFSELAGVEEKAGDRHGGHILDSYRAMMAIVGEDLDLDPATPGATGRERQFAKAYLDPNPNSPGAIDIRKRILAGANAYLNAKYFEVIETAITKSAQSALPGGIPDVISKIRAYVRLLAQGKHLAPDNSELQQANGDYVWAMVFFLLRSGHVNEAARYVNDQHQHFRSLDRTFPGYLNSYASSEDRRLKRQLQERCTNEYNQRVRNAPENSIDPFRMACYKIVGRCDLNNRSFEGLNTDVNDWIWLQFNLAREGDRALEFAGELFGLAELQATIKEVGLKYFPKSKADDSSGNFGMFFYLQILSGLFEQAIAYLYSFSYVDAVHFAIALEYYGLLRAADDMAAGNELLSHTTRGLPQISFGRMVGYYTRDFRAANVAAAVDYIILICLNSDESNASSQEQGELCHEALRELVLETREFSKLIGDIRPDGRRIPGIIESRGQLVGLRDEQEFIQNITMQAARFADDNGRTTDAVLLYHLAEDYDTVVAIVSRALSEAISLEIGEDPMRLIPVKPRVEHGQAEAQPGSSLSLAAIDDPIELAQTMMSMYEKDRFFREKVKEQNSMACRILLEMSTIKSLVEGGHWTQSLDKIRPLGILPLDAKGDPSIIRTFASRFSSYPQSVAINVPNLLMWTIICCTKQRERLTSGQFSGNETTARMLVDNLKQMSVDLTTFTSQLRYRFPPHLHEALARASAD